ncbi:Transcriptional regulatory protein DcuR [bioreactor metagenome]|uniref:Transcriptional regulatory protein DcuR n=1 Tax=bioreactor metagenome TaxID=1076179 RepID=A0A644T3L6_9ZZZZ|nr:response regulator [Negativicutes bacterium]
MLRVLIVEDDPMVAELNRRFLEKLDGFTLSSIVNNGKDALSFLEDNTVDLVLLDVFMPGMNGLELLSAIRRQQYGIDVILVTAARDKQSVQSALRQGAVDYLIKPFEFERFKSALTGYKQRLKFIEQQEQLSQPALDTQIFNQLTPSETNELPKGLDQHTMRRVWKCIVKNQEDFTAETMAETVGLSQVSMRKYLKYLTSIELLTVNVCYGSIGRPISKYHYNILKTNPFFMQ